MIVFESHTRRVFADGWVQHTVKFRLVEAGTVYTHVSHDIRTAYANAYACARYFRKRFAAGHVV